MANHAKSQLYSDIDSLAWIEKLTFLVKLKTYQIFLFFILKCSSLKRNKVMFEDI
jgi:hypothetical protein